MLVEKHMINISPPWLKENSENSLAPITVNRV